MESRVLGNGSGLLPEEALPLIHELFKQYFPDYTIIDVFNAGGFYGFGVTMQKDNIRITFGGGRGYFDHSILIEGKRYSLRDYDEIMKEVKSTSEKNYRYAIIVLVRFLESIGR